MFICTSFSQLFFVHFSILSYNLFFYSNFCFYCTRLLISYTSLTAFRSMDLGRYLMFAQFSLSSKMMPEFSRMLMTSYFRLFRLSNFYSPNFSASSSIRRESLSGDYYLIFLKMNSERSLSFILSILDGFQACGDRVALGTVLKFIRNWRTALYYQKVLQELQTNKRIIFNIVSFSNLAIKFRSFKMNNKSVQSNNKEIRNYFAINLIESFNSVKYQHKNMQAENGGEWPRVPPQKIMLFEELSALKREKPDSIIFDICEKLKFAQISRRLPHLS